MSMTANDFEMRSIIGQVVKDPAYKKVAQVPLFSVHQLALIIASYAVIGFCIYANLKLHVSIWLMYPIMIFAFYTAFTPLHDATHRAVSSNKFLNDLFGTISGFLLFPMSNVAGYRYLHLAHHRFVGDENLDPDEPLVSIPTKYFPFGYLVLLLPDALWVYWLFTKSWKRTPSRTRLNVLFMIFGNVAFHLAFLLSPIGWAYLILFFVPNRLGIAYTAFAFAHAPHPHGVKWNEQPVKTTFILKANLNYLRTLYGQAHHSIHHFLPNIPWYKYFQVWDLANGTFKNQPIPEKHIFSKPTVNYLENEIDLDLPETYWVKITSAKEVTPLIKTFTFESADTALPLPNFSAGAHINLFLPSGKIRSYSILNNPSNSVFYQIAVKKEVKGKGGSLEVHNSLKVGDSLKISKPKNNFVLYENKQKYILFAGGIGITPLLSMAHRLQHLKKNFEFHIACRKKSEVPFLAELMQSTFASSIVIHEDNNGKSSMDANAILSNPNSESLIYICGPSGYNKWLNATALQKGWAANHIIQEQFTNEIITSSKPKAFQLELRNSNKALEVKADQTIIDALLANNINVNYSCLQGTCGTCVCDVIEGNVEHHDAILSEEEHKSKICLCVSRAASEKLVLDM